MMYKEDPKAEIITDELEALIKEIMKDESKESQVGFISSDDEQRIMVLTYLPLDKLELRGQPVSEDERERRLQMGSSAIQGIAGYVFANLRPHARSRTRENIHIVIDSAYDQACQHRREDDNLGQGSIIGKCDSKEEMDFIRSKIEEAVLKAQEAWKKRDH